MAGFGARILRPDDIPKFLNSPQTDVFDKGRLLYGLDRARRAIRSQDQVVIVEGYLDVIALHQAGFANAVSPMGTALSEHQLYRLKRYTRRIVLALDPDVAGDKATLRGLEVARKTMDREADPVFDARGLLGHEARLQADIRVTTLPEELDPDEVVNRDPDEWRAIVENARPVVVHVMETLAAGRDLDDPKTKSEIAAQVMPLIADVPNEIERDTYRQRLARLLRVDERSLITSVVAPRRTSLRRALPRQEAQPSSVEPEAVALPPKVSSNQALESHCLGVMLRRPDLLFLVDRRLQEAQLARLTAEDFRYADHQVIMRVFQQSVDQDLAEPQNYVLNSLDLPMMELADGLLERTTELDPNDERVMEDLMRGLLELRQRNLHQEIEHYQFLIKEAQEEGELQGTQYMQTMVQLIEVKRHLDRAIGQYVGRAATRDNLVA
jgi:DNA primase